jgi:hypothetical protein
MRTIYRVPQKEGKFALIYATKTCEGGDAAPFVLNLNTKWG